jgi:membrane fusion protein (multidrug efflux system)
MIKKIISLAILVSILALIVVQLKLNKTTSENRVYHYDKELPIAVYAQEVASQSSNDTREFTGTFEPFNEVKVNADVQGLISKIVVSEGDYLKKGQTILKIDDAILQLKLKAVNTQIVGLEKDVIRYQILSDQDAIQGIKLEKTLLGLESAQAERSIILQQINQTTIRAPFDGIVTQCFAEVGAFASPAMPLIELTNMDKLKFAINLTENELNFFKKNETYLVKANAFPTDSLLGKLIYTSSKGNVANGFLAEFEIENRTNLPLKSKMFGTVFLTDSKAETAQILVPSKCIIGSEIEPRVYLVKDGKAVLTTVVISERNGDYVTIKSGISMSDTIITGGFINLVDGANVIVSKASHTSRTEN